MEKLVNLGSRTTSNTTTTEDPYYSSYYSASDMKTSNEGQGLSTQTSSTKTMTSQQELSSYYATAADTTTRLSPQNSPYYTPDHKSHYYSQQPVQLRNYSSNFKSSDRMGLVKNKEEQANYYYYSHGGSSGDGLVGKSSSSSSSDYSRGHQPGLSAAARDAEEISRKFYQNSALYVEPKQIERVVPVRVDDYRRRSPNRLPPSPSPPQRERPARRIFFDDNFQFNRFELSLSFKFMSYEGL